MPSHREGCLLRKESREHGVLGAGLKGSAIDTPVKPSAFPRATREARMDRWGQYTLRSFDTSLSR